MSRRGDEIEGDAALEAFSSMWRAQDVDDVAALTDLVELSRTQRGRNALPGALEDALRRLPFSTGTALLLRLQLLRNLLAGDKRNRGEFFANSGAAAVVACSHAIFGDPDLARAALQALGNAALAVEPHRADVWDSLFPGPLRDFAALGHPGVVDPLCMVLHMCCSGSEGGRGRIEELCYDDVGLPIVVQLINTASLVGHKEELLGLLLFEVCVEREKFDTLFAALRSTVGVDASNRDSESGPALNSRHAFLLGVLSECLTSRPEEVIVSNSFAHHVFALHNHAAETVDFTCRGSTTLPCGRPTIDVLGYSLLLLRDICAWESPSTDAELPVDSLLQTGLVKCLLRYLYKLEPSVANRKLMASEQGDHLPSFATGRVCPYNGYRRDLVAVIANCLHKRKQVQDEVRQLDGIRLLLQQCVVDEENPCLRECGLRAVKRLLEGNVENQKAVSEFQMMQEPTVTPEIAEILFNTI